MDDQSKKAVELVQGVAKQLIGLAALIVAFSVVFADRLGRLDGDWTLIAVCSAEGLAIVFGIWMLFALAAALRGAANVETSEGGVAPSPWILGWNVRLPLVLQTLLFVAGIGLLASSGVARKPADGQESTQAAAPSPVDQLALRVARMETQFEERWTRADSERREVKIAAERMSEAVDKLTLGVGSFERALTEQVALMAKQQRVVANAAARQHSADIELAELKSECETMGSILGSLRTIMRANIGESESTAYRQFWANYLGPFMLVRTPALIQGVDECAPIVRELEDGPILNASLQAKLKDKVAALAKLCRSRFREAVPAVAEADAN